MTTPFPYDYFATERLDGWRERLILPMDVRVARVRSQSFARALMQLASRFDEERCTTYLAALPYLMRWALVVAETAMFLEALGHSDCASELSEFQFLSGRNRPRHEIHCADLIPSVSIRGRPLARQLLWTAKWTGWARLPDTLLNPTVSAFNHNPDLIDAALASRLPIRYDNVEWLYADAMRLAREENGPLWTGEHIREVLVPAVDKTGLSPEMRERLLDLLVSRFQPSLESVARDLRALRSARTLPQHAWTGTGGYWASRLVGLEIMRRGGTVKRFHHGWNMIISGYIEGTTAIEFIPSTHFVFPSEIAVERWRAEPTGQLSGHRAQLEVLKRRRHLRRFGGNGQSIGQFRRRPRVLFASEPLRGYRQWIPSWLPDAVTLDWTLRLGEALYELPIELVNRPHPEGLLRGRRHPLNDIAPVPAARFEQVLHDADVIVLDGSFSRVFCISLMTDKPVVLLNSGYDHAFENFRPDLEKRCTIIRVQYDDRGLPIVDRATLAHAVLETSPPDLELVNTFRKLFGEVC